MEDSVETLLRSVSSRLAGLREYRAMYDRELAFDFDPIRRFCGNRLWEQNSSAILAFFLDPSETHAQGDVFLREFLKLIAAKSGYKDFEACPRPSLVKCEFKIPDGSPDEGGQMDILLRFEDPPFHIAIENKIWAEDQPKQIDRYHAYLEKQAGKHVLVYLTSDGRDPSEGSMKKGPDSGRPDWLVTLSWRRDIVPLVERWIGLCRAERVREYLKDFQHAINAEMGGGMDMSEETQVAEMIAKSPESIEAAKKIMDAWYGATIKVFEKFKQDMKSYAGPKGLDFVMEPTKMWGKYEGFEFMRGSWDKYKIEFDFETSNLHDLAYGIVYKNHPLDRNQDSTKRLESLIIKQFPPNGPQDPPGATFPVSFWVEKENPKYKNWDTSEVLAQILAGESSDLYKYIFGIVEKLGKVIDKAEEALR